jgi:hypothetical protein
VPTPDVRVGVILEVLARHGVDYVVIGGFAVELHDVAIPPTRDIDITPSQDADNLTRLSAVLSELGARIRVPGGPGEGVEIAGGITAHHLASLVTATFVTDAGPLDLSFIPDGTDGYEDLASGQVTIEYEGRSVSVANLEDVLRSKEAAGRENDFLVIPAIRAHLRRRNR